MNHTQLINNEFFNTSQQEMPFGSFNSSNNFEEWTPKDAEETAMDFSSLFDSNNFSSSNFSVENSTEVFDSIETSSLNSLKVRNSVREIDENAINVDENKIFFEDDYPHINYNDYGFLVLDNATVDYFQDRSSPSPEYPTEGSETSFPRVPYTTTIINPSVMDSPTNSCAGLSQILRCYERICETKTVTSDNFSGILFWDLFNT
jgi:hypothetical protein